MEENLNSSSISFFHCFACVVGQGKWRARATRGVAEPLGVIYLS